MKYLIVSVILLSYLPAQDTLITIQGHVHLGKYITKTENFIEFKVTGAAYSMFPEKAVIARVILEDGQIIYNDSTYTAPSTAVSSMLDSATIAKINTKNLELRQTVAQERIATAATVIMYISVASLVAIIYMVSNTP